MSIIQRKQSTDWLTGVMLFAALLGLMFFGVARAGEPQARVASGVLTAPPKGALPGRQAATATPTPAPDGWRLTGGIEMRQRDDGTWRIDLDFWLRAEPAPPGTPPVAPTATDAPPSPGAPTGTPTMTPSSTPFPTNTPRPTNTATPAPTATPSATPIATASEEPPTPTPEDACVVRSTANVWARTLPIVRSDTGIGVLPADSPVRITGYTVEQVDANTSYIWYRYWFDVDHPEAWSRADFFTERDDSPGCRLLPRVTEP